MSDARLTAALHEAWMSEWNRTEYGIKREHKKAQQRQRKGNQRRNKLELGEAAAVDDGGDGSRVR
jgi:hypothetical protein